MARIVELIETEELRGKGTEENLYRRVYQFWTKAGRLVFEYDPWTKEAKVGDQRLPLGEGEA